MKSRITLLMVVAIILFATPLFSQEEGMKEKSNYSNLKKWEIGAFLGLSNYQGDLIVPIWSISGDNVNFGYGLHLKYNFSPNFGLRLNYKGTSLSGDEINYEENGHAERAYSFGIDTDKTSLNEVSALIEWDLLGKRRYRGGSFTKTVSPYLFGGIGYSTYDANPNFNKATGSVLAQNDIDNKETSGITIPLGAGLNFDLSENFYIGLEVGFRPGFTDYLDGISEAADPEDDDWYSFGGLNINYRLSGKKDADGDGIPDKNDKCPNLPGESLMDGCPDRDGDGVTDKKDNCPDIAGSTDLKGCPDTDGDGIIDIEDQCPQVAGGSNLRGCPDSDGDGVIDMEDQCPNTAGLKSKGGCPDTDGDGIVDANDECPSEPGTSLNNGCPEKDRDGDGIKDGNDDCPDVAGIGKFKGCPDTDNDGIQDSKDKCATTPGPASNGGCPEINQADRQLLQLAVQAVRFETSRDALKTESYAILDQVVDILNRYPDYNVRVRGYTDDRGNAAANQKLSENRARTCAKYLENKGVSRSRISSQGYGETNPISTNDTPQGRRMNRRVEFDLNLR